MLKACKICLKLSVDLRNFMHYSRLSNNRVVCDNRAGMNISKNWQIMHDAVNMKDSKESIKQTECMIYILA